MLFFAHFWCRFWCRFGSHLAPILGLLGAQVGPSWVQNCSCHAIFIQNAIFKKTRKTNGFSMFLPPQMAPKTPQDRSKTAPRRSSRGTFSMSKNIIDFVPFWDRFWLPLGTHFGHPKGSQNRPNYEFGAKASPRGPKRPPRGFQEAPGRPQEAPKRPPRGRKMAPRGPKMHPKREQVKE